MQLKFFCALRMFTIEKVPPPVLIWALHRNFSEQMNSQI